MRKMKLIKQFAIICAVCFAGGVLAEFIPLPSTILAMAIMLILLAAKIIRVESISEASGFILGNMAMFFIPANVSILEKLDYMTGNILKLILVCIITTVITFAAGAYTVTAVSALQKKFAASKAEKERSAENAGDIE